MSEIKVDKIEGSTGSTITIPTGQTFTITDGLGVASGATGITSFTAGDLLYATGTTTLAKLGKGTTEQTLKMNTGATAPEYGTTHPIAGGTGLTSYTTGDFLYADTTTSLAKLPKGSNDEQTVKQVLTRKSYIEDLNNFYEGARLLCKKVNYLYLHSQEIKFF